MTLYSYVVARDYGFAPNPFYRCCTLATCKPILRRMAQVGDWVIGTGSKSRDHEDHLVFAMLVTETLTFDEYWLDSRFSEKRPNLSGSKKQAFGDNIYHRDQITNNWIQENSHHSYENGKPNQRNIDSDTKTNRVLLSDKYVYSGGYGPTIPSNVRNFGGVDLRAARGYKKNFPDAMVHRVVEWIKSHRESGYVDKPLDWDRSA